MTESCDVAIIGAGPIGLFSAFTCGMMGAKSIYIIDALPHIGGQCQALYPEKPIYDIPAYPFIEAKDLVQNLYQQAQVFKPIYALNQPITCLKPANSEWIIETTAAHYQAKAIILATGSGQICPNPLPLPEAKAYEGQGLLYSVSEKNALLNQNIIIVGGGDSALDWALLLCKQSKVALVHRRNQFRAHPNTLDKIYAAIALGDITLLEPYQLHRLIGPAPHLKMVELQSLKDGGLIQISADRVLAFFGLSSQSTHFSDFGIDQDKQGQIIVNPATCSTNLNGIFAIGDCATYSGKLKLIVSGFSEAASASHAIYPLLYPGKPRKIGYSTTQGIPNPSL
jgi:thioredoxin reductase (NADPH)